MTSPNAGRSVALRLAMSFVGRTCPVKVVPPGIAIGYGATCVTDMKCKDATIPVGHAAAYRRLLSNIAEVVFKDKRVPILGRVAIDMYIDLTSIPDVCPGEHVIRSGVGLPMDEMASIIVTVNCDVVTGIGKRVPRPYR